TLEHPKTKEFLGTLGALKLGGKTLIVDSLKNTKLMLASRNVQTANGVNSYDLVNHQKIVLTPKTVEELIGILQPRAKDDEEAYHSRHDADDGGQGRRVPGNR